MSHRSPNDRHTGTEATSVKDILSDEPAGEDRLGRQALARAFAELSLSCETPLVTGIFGTWGSGKTTFLRLIENELSPDAARAVWFNAWQHDQDDAPAVSLLHATVGSLGLEQKFRSTLTKVALAFGSVLLQRTTTLSLEGLEKVQKLVDEEGFRVRDARAKLRTHFEGVIAEAGDQGRRRVVFFIDDLDRCTPESVLRTLEAIKLYFNLPGCVFFLGMDRETIEGAIQGSVAQARGSETNYLDKMVQLPFVLPPVAEPKFHSYLASLLPAELHVCLPVMTAGLERNPRSVKRFVNNLLLRHRLAQSLQISNYDPRLVALLLLFEQLQPALFRSFARDPGLLIVLHSDRERAEQEITSPRLRDALFANYVPRFAPLSSYVSLTNLDIDRAAVEAARVDVARVLPEHRIWLRSFRREGRRGVLRRANLSKADLNGAMLREAAMETADLSGAQLRGSDLRRADLAGANLSGADLSGAILRHADLRESDLGDARVRGADLRGADLTRANLRGADLRLSVGLTDVQVRESLVDSETQLPVYLELPFTNRL